MSASHMDCARCRDLMEAALAGDLAAAERAAFEAHTAMCPPCAARLDALRRTERWIARAPAPAPPRDFRERVLREARSHRPPARITCEHVRIDLWAWRSGDLSPAYAARLEAHAEKCRACGRRVALAIRTEALWSGWEAPSVPAGFRRRTLARAGAARRRSAPLRLAAAAVLLAASVAALLWSPLPGSDDGRVVGRSGDRRAATAVRLLRREQYPQGVGSFASNPVVADRAPRRNGALFHRVLRRALAREASR